LRLPGSELGLELVDAPRDVLERVELSVDEPAHRVGHLRIDLRAMCPQRIQSGLLAPGKDHAELVQQPAQGVDRGRAHAHPVLPRAV